MSIPAPVYSDGNDYEQIKKTRNMRHHDSLKPYVEKVELYNIKQTSEPV